MRSRHWLAGIGISLLALMPVLAPAQQEKSARPSPPGTAELVTKNNKIAIEYSRPSMRGRKILGELVPFGQVWRTGANEATSLSTDADVNIGGVNVPAGKYTLFTLPSETGWKLIINKQTGQWGTIYDEKQDLARIDMKASQTKAPVEQFTISFKTTGPGNADLMLEWENTIVSVAVKAR
ncbi:MAG TPA: DUF2911 domain-containing protein [Candidatus Saccharimonadales bacterium]|jgi:hypothetical protein|nr:DUF2911 domain-containing protein [Candidatus Saccharimonadales bacterium]